MGTLRNYSRKGQAKLPMFSCCGLPNIRHFTVHLTVFKKKMLKTSYFIIECFRSILDLASTKFQTLDLFIKRSIKNGGLHVCYRKWYYFLTQKIRILKFQGANVLLAHFPDAHAVICNWYIDTYVVLMLFCKEQGHFSY